MKDTTKIILIVWVYIGSRLITLIHYYWDKPMQSHAFELLGIILTFTATLAYLSFSEEKH